MTATDHSIASLLGGSVSALVFYPLDLIRVRFVSQDGTDLRKHRGESYRNLFHALSSILKHEGVSALYRGASLGVFASGFSWGAYMFTYRHIESFFASTTATISRNSSNNKEKEEEEEGHDNGGEDNNNKEDSRGLAGFPLGAISSASASILVSFLSTPLFLIKTRMQLEDVARGETRVNRSFLRGFQSAVEKDGVRSLWRGFSAQLVMCVTMAMYMPLYESMRRPLCRYLEKDKLGPQETAAITICAKLGVSTLAHPIALVKARLQDQRARTGETRYVSLAATVRTIAVREGVFGFYRGLTVGLTQSTCRSVLQMQTYEAVLQKVSSWRK